MKGILFDLDGTLLDSMPVWVSLAENYLKQLGVEPPKDLRKQIKAMTLKEAMIHFKEQFALDDDVEEMIAAAFRILSESYRSTIALKPHVREVLERLHEKGVPMAVATATTDELSKPAIEHHGLHRYFSFVQTVANSGYTKREKEFWEAGAARLGMDPKDIVVFEDALHAMESAKAAGMRVIAIEDESARRDAEAIRSVADVCLSSFEEFRPEHLEGTSGS